MCMSQNSFEEECDEIGKYSSNRWMQYMSFAAYIIRRITSGVSYGDAKELLREFISNVDRIFNTKEEMDLRMKKSLTDLGIQYLRKIRSEQKEKGEFESFITCASPIVPYNQTIRRKDMLEDVEENTRVDISHSLKIDKGDLIQRIEDLLLNNVAEIMVNYDLCTCLYDSDDKLNLTLLDTLMIHNEKVSLDTQKYYFLATMNFYNLQESEEFVKYLEFYNAAGNFDKNQNYSAFESMILKMVDSTNIDIAAESWDDPSMELKEEKAVNELINSYIRYEDNDEENSKYDLGKLNDFINVKRFMKFDEFANRLFISSVEKSKIININNMGGNRNYYEMDNHTIACPFLDLRTYQVNVVVLHADTQNIEIIGNIKDLY